MRAPNFPQVAFKRGNGRACRALACLPKLIAFALLPAALLFSLSGCAPSHQPEHRAYVISMGVDTNDNSDCVVSIQIPSITGSSSSADGESGMDSYVVSTATAHTFLEALVLLQATTPRELDYRQMVSFVASQRIASSPVFPEILTELMHTYEIYHAPQLIVCAGEAAAFLESQRPEIGTRLSSSVSAMLDNYQRQGYIPLAELSRVYYLSQSIYHDPVAIYAATPDQEHYRNVAPDNVGESYPGSLPHTGLARNEYMGAALLKDGVMVGTLDGTQTQILNLLTGTTDDMVYFVEEKNMLLERVGIHMGVDIAQDGAVTLRADIHLTVKPLTSAPDPQEVREKFLSDLTGLISTCQALQTDPFGFALLAASQFDTVPEWSAFLWPERFAQATLALDVHIIM